MRAGIADLVLAAHAGIVLFIVGGLLLVWIGAWRDWAWVRQRAFRFAHLAAIAFVALEAMFDVVCPLTHWEAMLRGGEAPASFVGVWLERLLYYRAPGWVFLTAYIGWAVLTALTLRWVPPRPRLGR